MGSERIRVLIADDHRLFREALRVVLERECEVVGEAASGEEAVTLAARTRPDIVLLDVGMPGVGGLNAAHRLAKEAPASKVVILSQHDDGDLWFDLLDRSRHHSPVQKAQLVVEHNCIHRPRHKEPQTIGTICSG